MFFTQNPLRKIILGSAIFTAIFLLSILPKVANAQYGRGIEGSWRARKWKEYNQHVKETYGKDQIFRSNLILGAIFTNATIKFTLRPFESGEPLPYDTSMNYISKPQDAGLHLAWTTTLPITHFSEDAALLFSFGVSWDNLEWVIPEFTYAGKPHAYSFSTNIVGVPLFLDYVKGAEANMDIDKRIMFTAGAGVLPSYTLGEKFALRPGARVEVGLTTKFVCFKLQAMGLLGNMQFENSKNNLRNYDKDFDDDESYDINIVGHNQFIISLALIPMSQIWTVD